MAGRCSDPHFAEAVAAASSDSGRGAPAACGKKSERQDRLASHR